MTASSTWSSAAAHLPTTTRSSGTGKPTAASKFGLNTRNRSRLRHDTSLSARVGPLRGYSNGMTSNGGSRDAVIAAYVRSPIGRYGGALADVRPDTLAATTIRALLERTGIDPAEVDDVILGCANQAGEDNRNVARMALLL